MTLYRCRICGDPYAGSEKPSHCAFCGAHQKHLAPAAECRPVAVGELTEASRDNLLRVLDLEVGNSTFYRGAAKVADTGDGAALFGALSRIEAEHAVIVSRILGMPKPEELDEIGACSPSHKENLAEARQRQEQAAKLYRKCLDEAGEERVRQVLEAFIEIESDHLLLCS